MKKKKKSDNRDEVDLFDKVLELRKFEIDNFWKRTLFFWGALAVILLTYFKSKIGDEHLVFISLIGILYTFIFSLSIRGSKYWQEHWEVQAKEFKDDIKLFDEITTPTMVSKFTFPYRFSVSKLTMLLSDLTVLMWVMFWIKDVFFLVKRGALKFEFSLNSSIDYFTLAVVLFHLVLVVYMSVFLYYGDVYHKTGHNEVNDKETK